MSLNDNIRIGREMADCFDIIITQKEKEMYKVEYHTLSRGKIKDSPPGNQWQFDDIAYIQCSATNLIELMLEKHYSTPSKNGVYFVAVIDKITRIKGHIVT